MNYKKLMDLQYNLDKSMDEAHSLLKRNILKEKTIALIVEFSEFANELGSFKYWKKNKKINVENLYLEYADVLHFLFSFFVSNDIDPNDIETADYEAENIMQAFLDFNRVASNIYNNESINKESLRNSYSILLSIAKVYDLDDFKIEEYYIMKNKINYDRIANNY